MSNTVAERFRAGPVFLVGDAARSLRSSTHANADVHDVAGVTHQLLQASSRC